MSAHRSASSKALPIVTHAICLLWSIFLLIRWIVTIPKLVPQSVMMLSLLSSTFYQVAMTLVPISLRLLSASVISPLCYSGDVYLRWGSA